MSFWKRLFGGSGSAAGESSGPAKSIEHKGFTIHAEPYKSEGQYQTAGRIQKDVDGLAKEHRFIRADRFASFDEAVEFALLKGRQIVDEQGERIFR